MSRTPFAAACAAGVLSMLVLTAAPAAAAQTYCPYTARVDTPVRSGPHDSSPQLDAWAAGSSHLIPVPLSLQNGFTRVSLSYVWTRSSALVRGSGACVQ